MQFGAISETTGGLLREGLVKYRAVSDKEAEMSLTLRRKVRDQGTRDRLEGHILDRSFGVENGVQ